MQGVKSDFGVDVASELSNGSDFRKYVTRFSGIKDDPLHWEKSLTDIGSMLFGHEIPVCCDVDSLVSTVSQ